MKINLNPINFAKKVFVKTSSSEVVAEPFPYLTVYIYVGGKCNP